AAVSSANAVRLTFSQPDDRTFDLSLERATGAGAFAEIKSFPIGDPATTYCPPNSTHTYTDTNLAPGTYSYRIVVRNLGTGQKAVISPVVTVTVPPSLSLTPSPLNLRVNTMGNLTATLSGPLATDVTLALSSTSPNVAAPSGANPTIPAGQTSVQVPVSG